MMPTLGGWGANRGIPAVVGKIASLRLSAAKYHRPIRISAFSYLTVNNNIVDRELMSIVRRERKTTQTWIRGKHTHTSTHTEEKPLHEAGATYEGPTSEDRSEDQRIRTIDERP